MAKPKSTPRKVPPRPSTTKKTATAPARGPATRQVAQRRRNQRNLAIAASVVVVVVVAILVIVKVGGGGSHSSGTTLPSSAIVRPPASASAQAAVTGLPLATLVHAAETVSTHSASPPAALPSGATPLTSGGKPELLYIGAEFCPFCAAERWPLVMALSKFGTFGTLLTTSSSPTDTNPSTPTFFFSGSSYSSPYLVFTPVETEDRFGHPLQAPTADQTALIQSYDSGGTIPFVLIGGKFGFVGAQYEAGPLAKMTFDEAATYLASGTNTTSRDAEAAAGHLIGAICSLTGNQPAQVCSAVPASLKSGGAASNNGSS